jgi:hypothetical protein
MLKLVSEFVKHEDPDLFEVLGKLTLIRVQVFKAGAEATKKFIAESSKTLKALNKKGWEQVVRTNENDEQVHVYLKPSDNYDFIQGILVTAVEKDDEAVFVNIAGDIHPDDIGRLSSYFGIDELDSIRYEAKKDK